MCSLRCLQELFTLAFILGFLVVLDLFLCFGFQATFLKLLHYSFFLKEILIIIKEYYINNYK